MAPPHPTALISYKNPTRQASLREWQGQVHPGSLVAKRDPDLGLERQAHSPHLLSGLQGTGRLPV